MGLVDLIFAQGYVVLSTRNDHNWLAWTNAHFYFSTHSMS